MKKVLLILILAFNLNCFSQKLMTGVATSFSADDFSPYLYGSLVVGIGWNHVSFAPVFSKTLGYRGSSIVGLGLTARFQIRPEESLFNLFMEAGFSSQISGKRANKAVDENLSLVEETSFRFHGERFLKESFNGFAGVGVSFTYKEFQLFSSFGYSTRHWQHYNDIEPYNVEVSKSNGLGANVGLRYFIPLKEKKEKYIIVPSSFQDYQ